MNRNCVDLILGMRDMNSCTRENQGESGCLDSAANKTT